MIASCFLIAVKVCLLDTRLKSMDINIYQRKTMMEKDSTTAELFPASHLSPSLFKIPSFQLPATDQHEASYSHGACDNLAYLVTVSIYRHVPKPASTSSSKILFLLTTSILKATSLSHHLD